MPINFPGGLDSLTNPTPSDNLNTPAVLHSDQHSNTNDAIEALEAKVGIDNSLVTGSFDYRIRYLESVPSHSPVTLGVANGLSLSGQQLSMSLAGANSTGTLSAQDWTTFNSKQAALTITAKLLTLLAETNVKGTFINDALTDETNPDMGADQTSNRSGYYTDTITDKYLTNMVLRYSTRNENGSFRIDVTDDPDTFEVYLRGAWYQILYDLTTAFGDLRHTPLAESIYVWRGDSVRTDLGGRPVISEYQADMGAYRSPRLLNGGTF